MNAQNTSTAQALCKAFGHNKSKAELVYSNRIMKISNYAVHVDLSMFGLPCMELSGENCRISKNQAS